MTLATWLGNAVSRPIVRNAATTALIVGPLLTLINQGDALMAGLGLDWLKVALTFAVPYGVATVAGANARTAAGRHASKQTGPAPDEEIGVAMAAVARARARADETDAAALADVHERLARLRKSDPRDAA